MEKTDRRSRTRRAIIILIALVLLVYIIGVTYARYSTQGLATASTDVAKWAVVIKNGNTTLSSTTQNIPFVVQSNQYVVPGKIAPAVTATATVELDLTGTEVAVDFDAVIDNSALATIGASADKLVFSTEVDGTTYTSGTSQLIPLVNNAAFTSANGKKTVTLILTWENDDNNNPDDTTMGEAAPTINIPVTLTAKQHIGATATPTP